MKKRTRGNIIELIVYVLLIFFCIFIVPKYFIQRTVVIGESMNPTLNAEDSLFVEKISKHFTNPSRYDIIVFEPHKTETDEYYVKRVIGLPGETVQIQGSDIFIDGKKISDGYGKEKNAMGNAGIAATPIKLKKDEYFVLGDNRTVSLDSRSETVGPVKQEQLVGKVLLRIWPLSDFGVIEKKN